MNARRIAGSLVFAAAALASIATSAPLVDTVEGFGTIDSTEVLPGPATAFSITAEAQARVGDHDGGDVEVSVQVQRLGDIAPAVKVSLISETDPSLDQMAIVGDGGTANFFLPAWQRCETDPCFEDYRLEIENLIEESAVIIRGDIHATLQARDNRAASESRVLIQVVPLGLVE